MSSPRFHVNELVILQSKAQPECNGEYTIERILLPNKLYTCRITGKPCEAKSLTYLFTEPLMNKYVGVEAAWLESSLRKKHTPSSDSFTSMMDKLKIGSLV